MESQHINVIIQREQIKRKLAQYFLACAYNTPIHTLPKSQQKGYLHSWPGIDQLNGRKILCTTEKTEKGHMNQERQNLQSTKEREIEIEEYMFPTNSNTFKNMNMHTQ